MYMFTRCAAEKIPHCFRHPHFHRDHEDQLVLIKRKQVRLNTERKQKKSGENKSEELLRKIKEAEEALQREEARERKLVKERESVEKERRRQVEEYLVPFVGVIAEIDADVKEKFSAKLDLLNKQDDRKKQNCKNDENRENDEKEEKEGKRVYKWNKCDEQQIQGCRVVGGLRKEGGSERDDGFNSETKEKVAVELLADIVKTYDNRNLIISSENSDEEEQGVGYKFNDFNNSFSELVNSGCKSPRNVYSPIVVRQRGGLISPLAIGSVDGYDRESFLCLSPMKELSFQRYRPENS